MALGGRMTIILVLVAMAVSASDDAGVDSSEACGVELAGVPQGCSAVSQRFEYYGVTADHRPYFRGLRDSSQWLYYDQDCGGRSG